MSASLTHARVPRPQPSREAAYALQRRVTQYLRERRFPNVQVQVDDEAVILSGRVSSGYERQVLALSLHRMAGGRELRNEIEVYEPVIAPEPRWQPVADVAVEVVEQAKRVPRTVYALGLVAALIPLFLAACGGPVADQLPVYPVSGKAIAGDVPAAGALIVLHPQGHALPPGLAATATVQPDGSFQIGTYSKADGAPPGNYAVTVRWNKLTDNGPGPNVLAKEYESGESSPLKVTVEAKSNSLPEFKIPLKIGR